MDVIVVVVGGVSVGVITHRICVGLCISIFIVVLGFKSFMGLCGVFAPG